MTDQVLRTLEAERNKLWAEARLKGLPQGTPARDRITELDTLIAERKGTLRA